jgi:hypothetical protein
MNPKVKVKNCYILTIRYLPNIISDEENKWFLSTLQVCKITIKTTFLPLLLVIQWTCSGPCHIINLIFVEKSPATLLFFFMHYQYSTCQTLRPRWKPESQSHFPCIGLNVHMQPLLSNHPVSTCTWIIQTAEEQREVWFIFNQGVIFIKLLSNEPQPWEYIKTTPQCHIYIYIYIYVHIYMRESGNVCYEKEDGSSDKIFWDLHSKAMLINCQWPI